MIPRIPNRIQGVPNNGQEVLSSLLVQFAEEQQERAEEEKQRRIEEELFPPYFRGEAAFFRGVCPKCGFYETDVYFDAEDAQLELRGAHKDFSSECDGKIEIGLID